jgi:hypothetical protein
MLVDLKGDTIPQGNRSEFLVMGYSQGLAVDDVEEVHPLPGIENVEELILGSCYGNIDDIDVLIGLAGVDGSSVDVNRLAEVARLGIDDVGIDTEVLDANVEHPIEDAHE